jgi:hypothetical protein
MKLKILQSKIVITIFAFILILAFIPINNAIENQYVKTNPPKPGSLIGEFPIFELSYDHQNRYTNEIIKTSFNEDIISLISDIDDQMILGYLENLTSFGPRETATPACDESGEYIYNEFNNMGLDVRKHEWIYYDDLYGDNIEATLHGVNESSDEIYIICAHYDSVEGSPGADDDGSGVAAVLIAAEIMSKHVFDHTIRFVTFSGEEQGLFGSFFYAEEANESNDNIVAVLNVDMIGFAETEEDASKISIYEDEYSEWITAFTTDLADQYYDYIGLEVVPSGYSMYSDHYYFWEFGYNGIFYAEYYFNDFYHSPDDTIENMNIPYAVKSSKLIIATLAELAHFKSEPLKPNIPEGSTEGQVDVEYSYASVTEDPQDDQVYYLFDWGDRSDSGLLGPYPSGEIVTASHIWNRRGDFNIRVKAKDENDHESIWSDPLVVSMPKNKSSIGFNPWIIRLIQRFPILELLI